MSNNLSTHNCVHGGGQHVRNIYQYIAVQVNTTTNNGPKYYSRVGPTYFWQQQQKLTMIRFIKVGLLQGSCIGLQYIVEVYQTSWLHNNCINWTQRCSILSATCPQSHVYMLSSMFSIVIYFSSQRETTKRSNSPPTSSTPSSNISLVKLDICPVKEDRLPPTWPRDWPRPEPSPPSHDDMFAEDKNQTNTEQTGELA